MTDRKKRTIRRMARITDDSDRLDCTLRRDIEDIFNAFDVDDSMEVDVDEFCDALSMLSIHLNADGMRELFDEIDGSGNGKLQMEEWNAMMVRSKKLLMGRNGPRITKVEVTNVVQSILVDTAHRCATKIQSNWRRVLARRQVDQTSGKATRRARSVSPMKQEGHMTQQLSRTLRQEETNQNHVDWVTHPVSSTLMQPGLSRLGVGDSPPWTSGAAQPLTQERAHAMFRLCQPPNCSKEENRRNVTLGEFSSALFSLLGANEQEPPPSLFLPEERVEIALWRTLLRRYLWLKLLHTTITDSKTMHGARSHRALQDNEKQRQQQIIKDIEKRSCFLTPDSMFRMRWDLVQVFVLCLMAMVVPLRVGFAVIDQRDPKWWFGVDVVLDLYFTTDILINCRTAYREEDNKIVAEPRQVCMHYLRTWFLIDVIACLPINYFLYILGTTPLPWRENYSTHGTQTSGTDVIKVVKVVRLLRLTKMLRMLKLKAIAERLQNTQYYQKFVTSFKLAKITILLLYLSHFLACFWYLVGDLDQNRPTRYGWVNRYYNDGIWNDYSGNAPTSVVTRYVTALFHSLTDFGMEFAETDIEMTWISIQHIIYEAFMAYLTGVLAGEIIVGNASKQKFSQKMGEIRELMVHHRIKSGLRKQVTTFYEHLNDTQTFFDEQAVLNEFPPSIRKKMVDAIYTEKVIEKVEFIRQLHERLQYELCILLQPLPARKGDVIIQEGDYGDEMYILVSGMCSMYQRERHGAKKAQKDWILQRTKSVGSETLAPDVRRSIEMIRETTDLGATTTHDVGERLQDLYDGSFFGEEALLQEEVTRKSSIVARSDVSSLLYLTKKGVESLRHNDRKKFIAELRRLHKLRKRQQKEWTKRAQRFDEHISKLNAPEQIRLKRDEFDRDPTHREMIEFEPILSPRGKTLKAEALEAMYARLCVRELRNGANAVDENRQGISLVLRGELRGQRAKSTSGRILGDRVRELSIGSADSTVTLSVGSCFSSLELIEEVSRDQLKGTEVSRYQSKGTRVSTKHYHVDSAFVHSKTATILWLDEETWCWTRMRDSRDDTTLSISAFGDQDAAADAAAAAADDDDESDDDGNTGAEEPETVQPSTHRSPAGRFADQDANPSESPSDPSRTTTAPDALQSLPVSDPDNISRSIEMISDRLDAQEAHMQNIDGKLTRIEDLLERVVDANNSCRRTSSTDSDHEPSGPADSPPFVTGFSMDANNFTDDDGGSPPPISSSKLARAQERARERKQQSERKSPPTLPSKISPRRQRQQATKLHGDGDSDGDDSPPPVVQETQVLRPSSPGRHKSIPHPRVQPEPEPEPDLDCSSSDDSG